MNLLHCQTVLITDTACKSTWQIKREKNIKAVVWTVENWASNKYARCPDKVQNWSKNTIRTAFPSRAARLLLEEHVSVCWIVLWFFFSGQEQKYLPSKILLRYCRCPCHLNTISSTHSISHWLLPYALLIGIIWSAWFWILEPSDRAVSSLSFFSVFPHK